MCSTRAVEGLMHVITFGYGYDKWLCDGVLFELHTGLSGVFARGGRTEKRERVPRGITRLALCDSGAFGRFVWSVVTSWWYWSFAYA